MESDRYGSNGMTFMLELDKSPLTVDGAKDWKPTLSESLHLFVPTPTDLTSKE
jgi:hypothetical protein